MTGSLVMSNDVTVSWLTMPLNGRDKSRPPISENRSMIRYGS